MELMTYKCPNCGGAIVFDGKNQQFKCESCDSIFSEEQLKQYNDLMQESEKDSSHEWNDNSNRETIDNSNSYICEFCGAEIITDSTTSASECPYCNNPIIMKDQLSGAYKPDCVIPFKFDKNAAVDALKNFYKGKRLLPKGFADENKIKKISGVYVPFWLFDCDVSASITYDATKVRHWSDSNYNYTETSHYAVRRDGTLEFEKIPVDGSTKMDDAYMDAIEPFHYNELSDFNPAYLSGYIAEKYDVDAKKSIPRANERIENSTEDVFASTINGFNSVSVRSKRINSHNGKVNYSLLPVWFLNSKWNNEDYSFAMNGQTGKVVGKLPVDRKKYWTYFAAIAAGIFAVGQLFVWLF